MVDVVHLTSLMLLHLLLVPFAAGALHLWLRNIEVGDSQARHLAAKSCFYGAVLLPLLSILPSQLTIALGPQRMVIFEGGAPVIASHETSLFVQSLCYNVVICVLVVMAALLCRTLVAAAMSEWLARSGSPLDPRSFGLPLRIRLRVVESVEGPFVAGLLKPTIVLPRRLLDVPETELALLLRHELAHIERGDLMATFQQRLMEDIYWWNPAVRAIGRYWSEQREIVCDEVAADKLTSTAYTRALIGEARRRFVPAMTVGLAGAEFERRLLRLTSSVRRRIFPLGVLLVLLLIVGVALTPRASHDDRTYVGVAASTR